MRLASASFPVSVESIERGDGPSDGAIAVAAAWAGSCPPPEAAETKIRARLRALDARSVARTLALAGLLSLNRATLLPWTLGLLVPHLPPQERLQFAGYLDPLAIHIALGLAALLLALALLAGRRPLLAAVLATLLFLVAALPLVISNPVVIGGGHLGRVVMLLILLRAVANGLVYHAR